MRGTPRRSTGPSRRAPTGPAQQIAGALAARFARGVTAREAAVQGAPGVEVEVTAEVPPLGIWGPAIRLDVTGHAVEETAP